MIPFLLPLLQESDEAFQVQEVLNLAIAAFAILLIALSISAYRKTHLKRLLVISLAFGLFAVEVLIRQLDEFVLTVDFATQQVVIAALEFIILLLFFVAVVRK